MRHKISIIGSGNTGSTAAFIAAMKDLGEIVLIDLEHNINSASGKALDMLQAMPILNSNSRIIATADYNDTKGSDIVLITAGVARKPGMSRDDLIAINKNVMIEVTEQIVKHSPNSKIIVLTNPVDAMTYTVYKHSGFNKSRVIGQSGVLDTARFRTFIAEHLNVSVNDVQGFVLGGHGDTMVPLIRYSSVGGVPITDLVKEDVLKHIIDRTRKGGGEIVNLLEDGSAYYAPAAAMIEMAEAILKDEKRLLPSIAYLEGEYGQEDLYLGVPTIIGANGIEQIIELNLTTEEQQALTTSANSVRDVMKSL